MLEYGCKVCLIKKKITAHIRKPLFRALLYYKKKKVAGNLLSSENSNHWVKDSAGDPYYLGQIHTINALWIIIFNRENTPFCPSHTYYKYQLRFTKCMEKQYGSWNGSCPHSNCCHQYQSISHIRDAYTACQTAWLCNAVSLTRAWHFCSSNCPPLDLEHVGLTLYSGWKEEKR